MTSPKTGQFVEIGALLRKTRESRGEELSHAAYRIALSPAQLRAVESGDLQPFYNFPYYVQAAQRYAEFLGVTLPEINPPEGVLIPSVPDSIVKSDPAVRQAARSTSFNRNPVAQSAETSQAEEFFAAEPEIQVKSAANKVSTTKVAAPSFDSPAAKPEKQQNPWAWASAAMIAGVGVLGFSVMTAGMFPPELSPSQPSSNASNASNASNVSNASNSAAAAPSADSSTTSASTVAANAATTAATTASTTPSSTAPTTANVTAGPLTQAAVMPAVSTLASVSAPAATRPVAAAPGTTTGAASAGEAKFSMANQDSVVLAKATNWVQIVEKNGRKTNIDVEPGQSVDFSSYDTMVIVVRFADRASLTVRGKPVDLLAYKPDPEKPRALIYLDQVR